MDTRANELAPSRLQRRGDCSCQQSSPSFQAEYKLLLCQLGKRSSMGRTRLQKKKKTKRQTLAMMIIDCCNAHHHRAVRISLERLYNNKKTTDWRYRARRLGKREWARETWNGFIVPYKDVAGAPFSG
jgi:hypothetical protein